MQKKQLLLSGAGILILSSLLFFGRTVAKKEVIVAPERPGATSLPRFNIDDYVKQSSQKLTVNQQAYLANLVSQVKRGDVKNQQIKNFDELAKFWEDSVHNHNLHNFYVAESAKLVNSEKNLTFAAQQILKELRNEEDLSLRGWKAEQAIGLFEKAIEINPLNDSLKVGLGSCYVFGKGMAGDAQETMKGIQQLLQVVKKDSSNMQAQLVLGIGGVISTQYPKAIERLEVVVKKQPQNIEAISWLADAYAGKGDKVNALKWYQISKRIVNNPSYTKEVDDRIKMLK